MRSGSWASRHDLASHASQNLAEINQRCVTELDVLQVLHGISAGNRQSKDKPSVADEVKQPLACRSA